MKEQIEEIIHKYQHLTAVWNWQDVKADLLKIISNNDWLEYPKHKPSESGWYLVWTELTNLELAYWSDNEFNVEVSVNYPIAFKPIPVEPYVEPKNKYDNEVYLKELQFHLDTTIEDSWTHKVLSELKAKIENGDLK